MQDVPALAARIDEELKKRGPMWMLQRWEQASAAEGGEVVGELAAIASGSDGEPDKWRESWSRAMLRIMHSCASEFVGDIGMSTGAGAFKAFCHSIIPLHGDKLEGRVAMPSPDLEEAAKDLLADDSKVDCEIEAKARINSMPHRSFDELNTPRPGSVYSLKAPSLAPLFPGCRDDGRDAPPEGKAAARGVSGKCQ